MTDEGKQPTHQSIMVAIARVETSLTGVAERQKEHIKESQEYRQHLFNEVSQLNARTAVLESHESVAPPKSEPKMPRWAMAAAAVAILGGLASAVETVSGVAVAVFQSLVRH